MNLSKVDLNLFVVFEAVYNESNLTRAGQVLGITQPAVSNALSRLRETFDDPLFNRTSQGVSPTPVAEKVYPEIREALKLLRNCVLESESFDCLTSEKLFRFSMDDIGEAVLLPRILHELKERAPSVSVESSTGSRQQTATDLAAGKIDLAITDHQINEPQIYQRKLTKTDYVCIVRNQHPALNNPSAFTLDNYLDIHQVEIAGRPEHTHEVDLALSTLGRKRSIEVHVQQYLTAFELIQNSDLSLTAPRYLAEIYNLPALELPFHPPEIESYLYWHENSDKDAANRWMRAIILNMYVQNR